ncbi:type II toxin-antitoxin system RelB/DinJ family antitoxin [Sedimentibacter sp.]|uniref:type II toxin-antitoxin system RelB/DinJ family antitoxin n=1 Tax=Sedimentibacter sp. TaxID=1960295 RepID=UPI00289FCE61|nr:type II toxin-antitoxin system RelB/DinJ family antitoxin [Sedimentibacter sp.]
MSTTNITIRMDEELKKQAEELFADLGLTMTSAIIAFTKQAVREQRIPFVIARNIPNKETLEAFEEVEEMEKNPEKYKSYTNVDEMITELLQ